MTWAFRVAAAMDRTEQSHRVRACAGMTGHRNSKGNNNSKGNSDRNSNGNDNGKLLHGN